MQQVENPAEPVVTALVRKIRFEVMDEVARARVADAPMMQSLALMKILAKCQCGTRVRRCDLEFVDAGSAVSIAGAMATKTSSTNWVNSVAVIGDSLTDGVHCWEVQCQGGNCVMAGVCKAHVNLGNVAPMPVWYGADAWFMCIGSGALFGNGKSDIYGVPIKDGAGAIAEGDWLGMQLDLGAGTLSFFKNGMPHGDTHTGVVGPVKRCIEIDNSKPRHEAPHGTSVLARSATEKYWAK